MRTEISKNLGRVSQKRGYISPMVRDSASDDFEMEIAHVLFVDVVGSTEQASALGDRQWSTLRDRFENVVRDGLASHGGQFVDAAGDGVLATFDGPARAIRCASQVRDAVRLQGLEVRSGVHAGEIVRRQAGVSGIAVHIGARVVGLAEPGEVLVTRTVRDLVAGSGIATVYVRSSK